MAARRLLSVVGDAPPVAGAVAMGTGAVSIGMSMDGIQPLAWALLAIAAGAWAVVLVVLSLRALQDWPRTSSEVRAPTVLTMPAATAVVGSGLAAVGWTWASAPLLALASVLWLPLAACVASRWDPPTVGVSFLLAVSAEALAILGTSVAIRDGRGWVLWACVVLLGFGLAAYVWVISTFDFAQLLDGRGDHWIAGGALAIGTFAAARVAHAGEVLGWGPGAVHGLEDVSLGLWCLTFAWLLPLLACEVLRPRLRYCIERWSSVFPFGMYAICSFAVGSAVGVAPITDFAGVWIWVALALWLAVFAAMLGRGTVLALTAPDDAAVRGPSARPDPSASA